MKLPSTATITAACEAAGHRVTEGAVRAWRARAEKTHRPLPAWAVEATILYLGLAGDEAAHMARAMLSAWTPECDSLRGE